MAENRISHPFDLITIHNFNKIMAERQSNEQRLCPIHGQAVTLNHESYGGVDVGAPGFEAILSGCCDEAVNSEWEFMRKTVEDEA